MLKFLFVLMIALELYASLIPIDDSGIDLPQFDKVAHFLMHWINMCLAAIVFIKKRSFLVAALLLFLLGPVIELMQDMLPYRDASFADQLANTAGFLAGLFTSKRFLRGE
ncbi:MAG: VanZ family protein [Pseudomonadota bacterium]